MIHKRPHRSHRSGWLRAAVLGANDGIVSTASLVVGVAAASASTSEILVAGTAGLVAGAMSMAVGEYVSVSSQADAEKADLALEAQSIANNWDDEREELAYIYQNRGLSSELAQTVAQQLMAKDALAAHARDDIGISTKMKARPMQAALYSALTFSLGAALPLCAALICNPAFVLASVGAVTLVGLASLGVVSARLGGAPPLRAATRVVLGGAFAMGATALVGSVFGTVLK